MAARVATTCSYCMAPQHDNAFMHAMLMHARKLSNSHDHYRQVSIRLKCKLSLPTWQGAKGLLGSGKARANKARGGLIQTCPRPFFSFFIIIFSFNIELTNLRFEGLHGG